jgi:dipeptidyl-peptidase-4
MSRLLKSFYPVLLYLFLTGNLFAQYKPEVPSVKGWADDSSYIIQEYDKAGRAVYRKVSVRTGKSVTVVPEKTAEELFYESQPSGSFGKEGSESPDTKSFVILKEKDLFLFRPGEKELRRLTHDTIQEVNARFSPDSKKIAYTKKKDLYVFDLDKDSETRLTFDASDKIYNGYASWVYMEEILGRPSHYAAFWWAPDGNRIAYLRTDETDVPVFVLHRLDKEDGVHGRLEVVPYPYPGDPNPKVKMGIADIATAKTTWVKTDYSIDQYLAWPFWTPDSRKLAVQVLNRDQNDMKFIMADATSGDFTEIYREKSKTWVEFYESVHVLKNGSGFIVKSYRNGWENLYYYGWDGNFRQITDLHFKVNEVEDVDENSGIVYFSGTGEESTDNQFFRVGLDGKNLVQITGGEGTHTVLPSPKGSYFLDSWNSISSPGGIVILDKNGKKVRVISADKPSDSGYDKSPKSEMVRIKTADGLFDMPAIITYPAGFDPSKKYPVVFTVYGGPDYKNVKNTWSDNAPAWYSRNNIITFTVDHRGSGHFGRRGLDYLYRNLGKWEISDYSDAVKWLREKPFVDPSRIGITGMSYGGYMTCLAMTKGADFWTHGFAGAPVTDWRLYDNVYTERFMDTPAENPEGYKSSSALEFADKLKGPFYLAHGDIDDNVHLQNSIQLISRLEDEGKVFRFMLYPDSRHGWGGAKWLHYRNEIYNFWLENFFGNGKSSSR